MVEMGIFSLMSLNIWDRNSNIFIEKLSLNIEKIECNNTNLSVL